MLGRLSGSCGGSGPSTRAGCHPHDAQTPSRSTCRQRWQTSPSKSSSSLMRVIVRPLAPQPPCVALRGQVLSDSEDARIADQDDSERTAGTPSTRKAAAGSCRTERGRIYVRPDAPKGVRSGSAFGPQAITGGGQHVKLTGVARGHLTSGASADRYRGCAGCPSLVTPKA